MDSRVDTENIVLFEGCCGWRESRAKRVSFDSLDEEEDRVELTQTTTFLPLSPFPSTNSLNSRLGSLKT